MSSWGEGFDNASEHIKCKKMQFHDPDPTKTKACSMAGDHDAVKKTGNSILALEPEQNVGIDRTKRRDHPNKVSGSPEQGVGIAHRSPARRARLRSL
jgi:hypothetical protein